MQDQPQNLRGLKALVGFMAVLIVIGTTVVVGTLIHRFYAKSAPAPTTTASAPTDATEIQGNVPPPVSSTLVLAPGLQIEGMTSVGHDLALWIRGPVGDKVLLVDPRTGQTQTIVTSH